MGNTSECDGGPKIIDLKHRREDEEERYGQKVDAELKIIELTNPTHEPTYDENGHRVPGCKKVAQLPPCE